MNEKNTLIEALYQADELHNHAAIFNIMTEAEIFAGARAVLTDPNEGYLIGPTLIDAIRINFEALQQHEQIFDLLIFVLDTPNLDSLIYRTTQRTILTYSIKWQPREARTFHTKFEDNYLQALEQKDFYNAELWLEGNVLLPIYRKEDGLFLRSVGLLLTDPPPLVVGEEGSVDHLSIKSIKLLGHCFDYQPKNPPVSNKLKSMISVATDNPSVLSEVLYNSGICYLYDAFQADGVESLRESLYQALQSFDEAQNTEENRTDAALFGAITQCYLYLLEPDVELSQITDYVKEAQHLLFDRMGVFPDDLLINYPQVEFEIVRLASYFEQWVAHIAELPNQNLQPSLQLLARTYAAIRETEFTTEFSYSALETGEKAVMLPYTASQFIKSRELVNKLQSFIFDKGWQETASALEVEFYTLVYNELSGYPSPKEEAATRLEQIRVAAEKENPELAQNIKKLSDRGYGELEILEQLAWQQLDQDFIIDFQSPAVREIIRRLHTDLMSELGKNYSHFSELKWTLAFITHYFMRLYNTNATLNEKFLFKKPKGSGEDAREQDLQNHFYRFAKENAQGITCRLEESDIVPGRTDLALNVRQIDFPIEVKKEERDISKTHIHERYLAQSQTYATATFQVSFLFVLEVTEKVLGIPPKDKNDYCYVDKIIVPGAETPNCVCVFIFPGNRVSPSDHSWKK